MRRGMILPMLVMAVGGLCMLGGVALIIARIADPERAVQIIPGSKTPIAPTEGILLKTPLAPPPLAFQETIPIMPVMEVAGLDFTPAATATYTETLIPTETDTPTFTATSTVTPSLTGGTSSASEVSDATSAPPAATPTLTLTPTPTDTRTPIPFVTPTASITPSSTSTRIPRQPNRILIPSIDLDAPVVNVWLQRLELNGQVYSQWRVPDSRAAGWHETSAPLGQPGNTVLNGHHNIDGHVFGDLVNVQPGDTIRLEAADSFGLDYIVVQTMLLEEEGRSMEARLENARWLLPSDDERITLVTCWPPDGRSHRLVVVALPKDFVKTGG